MGLTPFAAAASAAAFAAAAAAAAAAAEPSQIQRYNPQGLAEMLSHLTDCYGHVAEYKLA